MSMQMVEAAELQNIIMAWRSEAVAGESVDRTLRSDRASVDNVIGLLNAVCEVANAINGDVLALQFYADAINITGTPRANGEALALKQEIAALETVRQKLEASRAQTQHKLDSAEATISMKLACAQARLREMI